MRKKVKYLLEQTFFQCFGRSFSPAMNMEFFVNITEVGVNGVVTDIEMLCDMLIPESMHNLFQDLPFTAGETVLLGDRMHFSEYIDRFPGDGRVHGGTAGQHVVYSLDDHGLSG